MRRLLTRRCLFESARLLAFYAAVLLALVSIAVIGPLVEGGAPLGAVLLSLPEQLVFPATLILPLALVTALLATVGRMREDGELIALQAAAISPLRVVVAMLLPALGTALLVGVLAHLVLPPSYQRWREGKTALLQQAVSAKVARQEPIYQQDGLTLAANGAEGERLAGVFARQRLGNGSDALVYAPAARWVNDETPDGERALRLELSQPRLMHHDGTGSLDAEIDAGRFHNLVVDLEDSLPDSGNKPDAKSTAELGDSILQLRATLARAENSDDEIELLADILSGSGPPPPLAQRIVDAQQLRDELAAQQSDGHQYVRSLFDARLRERLRDDSDTLTHEELVRALEPLPRQLSAARSAQSAGLPQALHRLIGREGLDDAAAERLGRLQLALLLPGHLRNDAASSEAQRITQWLSGDEQLPSDEREHLLGKLRKDLRGHELAWQLRWLLPLSCLSYWLVACALGLWLPARTRTVAVCLGLGTVLLTILPAYGIVKSLRAQLIINPGWILWPPLCVATLIGAWLCWKKR